MKNMEGVGSNYRDIHENRISKDHLRNLIKIFHDISTTIDAVFHDARKTEKIIAHVHHTLYKNKVQSLLKLKIQSQKDGLPPT